MNYLKPRYKNPTPHPWRVMRKLRYFCARTIGNIQLSRDVYPFMKLLTSRRVLLINPPVVREAEAAAEAGAEEESTWGGGREEGRREGSEGRAY
jgi:hypothetical protein